MKGFVGEGAAQTLGLIVRHVEVLLVVDLLELVVVGLDLNLGDSAEEAMTQRTPTSGAACEAWGMHLAWSQHTSADGYHRLLHASPRSPSPSTLVYGGDDHAAAPTSGRGWSEWPSAQQ